MEPIQVAGALMMQYMNGLSMTGPFKYPGRAGSAVRVWLPNGYGISLGSGYYTQDSFPEVAPIRALDSWDGKSAIGDDQWDYAWGDHPDFRDIMDSERCCYPQRAYEILSRLKEL